MRVTQTYTGLGWSKEQVETLISLYNQNVLAKDIVERIGKSKASIYSKLNCLGLYRRKSGRYIETEAVIAEKLREGKSVNEIRKELKISYCIAKRVKASLNIDQFQVKILSDTQAAYVAGIIDGEGCIMLSQRKSKGLPSIILSVANTHFGLIDYLGGLAKCGSIFDNKKKGNRRPQRRWMAHQRCAVEILRQVKPYMICKSKQLEIVCDFYDKFLNYHPWEYTKEEKDIMSNMVAEIHRLNKRGVL